GFADLLASHAMWRFTEINANPETYRALNEIRTALELAPNDPVVREIALGMGGMLQGGVIQKGDGFDFPWLTQTPTAWPTLEPTIAPVDQATPTTPAAPPAATEVAQAAPTQAQVSEATSTPAPQRSSPLCGSAAFLPLVAMFWFVWKRR
ncbi:MAG TPA: hypothetical protein VLE49_00445, partial [Anaerolineales bacterium]|nr:hypothetical protein [Anaerolineales bacterium]